MTPNPPPHPVQPIVTDADGTKRFHGNAIVRHLLDAGPSGMDYLAIMLFTDADRAQFAQLIGYSVCGFGELSYVSDATVPENPPETFQPPASDIGPEVLADMLTRPENPPTAHAEATARETDGMTKPIVRRFESTPRGPNPYAEAVAHWVSKQEDPLKNPPIERAEATARETDGQPPMTEKWHNIPAPDGTTHVLDADREWVATVAAGRVQLVQAAPELLACLLEAYPPGAGQHNTGCPRTRHSDTESCNCMKGRARAAITRTTGKEVSP